MKKLRRVCLLTMAALLLFTAEPVSAAKKQETKTEQGKTSKKKLANKWKTEKGKKYYYGADGKLAKGFTVIKGKTYFFNTKKGVMQTGWKKIKGKKYYFDSKGVMQNNGFLKIKGNYYYFNSDGTAQTGWKTIEGKGVCYFAKRGALAGVLQTGMQTIDGKIYYFGEAGAARGVMQTGWKTIDGKKYYFMESGSSKGAAQTGWLKYGASYYYFNDEGEMDPAKSVDDKRSGDSTGTALQKTQRRAEAIVSLITTPTMTKEQKLKASFDFVMDEYTGRRPRTPHYCGKDWPVVYANDMFLDGSGNCFSYAAAFAFLAKACGYEEVYACNSTGHGWTEINGLIYDPEEYRNTKYKYYGTSYSRVPGYRNAISDYKSPGMEFKHVKI